jgi:hypothetical protein
MKDSGLLIGQMVTDICRQARGLDRLRLGLFMAWLCAHSARMKTALLQQGDLEADLKPALQAWFESLSARGMLWEYRLILDEIAWWRELDSQRLHMLLRSETGRRDG